MPEICGHTVRAYKGTCLLDKGHKGYHTVRAFTCDGCGKRRRGIPWRHCNVRNSAGEYEDVIAYCFLCVKEGERTF